MEKESDNLNDVREYYDSCKEVNRSHKNQLEFEVTKLLLAAFLPKSVNILELGAGTGHYTEFLASLGHKVTAVELSKNLSEFSQRKIQSSVYEDNIQWVCGDAREYLADSISNFDAIVIMGPLYHMYKESERIQLLASACERLSDDGVVISCFLTKIGLLSYMLNRNPHWVHQSPEDVKSILESGINFNHPRDGSFRGHFTELAEIQNLHRIANLEVQSVHSQDPLIGGNDDLFNQMDANIKRDWVHLCAKVSGNPLAWGSGRSMLVVSKKIPL